MYFDSGKWYFISENIFLVVYLSGSYKNYLFQISPRLSIKLAVFLIRFKFSTWLLNQFEFADISVRHAGINHIYTQSAKNKNKILKFTQSSLSDSSISSCVSPLRSSSSCNILFRSSTVLTSQKDLSVQNQGEMGPFDLCL